jgi:hypothetical protein
VVDLIRHYRRGLRGSNKKGGFGAAHLCQNRTNPPRD